MELLHRIHWRPGIGDPTFIGWFTVFAYAVATWFAFQEWRHRKVGAPDQHIWLGVAVLMALLCLNKQFDVQTLFTEVGRQISRMGGWYQQRRLIQSLFVVFIIAGAAGFGIWFSRRYHRFFMTHRFLGLGLLFLLTFIVVRAVSFHHIDEFLHTDIQGFRANWILELGAISLIILAAMRKRKWRRPAVQESDV